MPRCGSTPFSEFVSLIDALGRTSGRLEKRRLLAHFLGQLPRVEVRSAVLFLAGNIIAESDSRALHVGGAALRQAAASSPKETQTEPMNFSEVDERLQALADVSGTEANGRRQAILNQLLRHSSVDERALLLRALTAELRVGVNEAGMLEAIALASGISLGELRNAHMFLGDLGRVAEFALFEGIETIRGVELSLFSPVKPMLADVLGELADVLAAHGGQTSIEPKMDGARVQIHRSGDEVRIFSRRLNDVTDSLPEISDLTRSLSSRSFVVEGEVLAANGQGRPLPFQELMRRFRRIHDVDALRASHPLELHLFDVLYLDGRNLMGLAYERRVQILAEFVPEKLRVTRQVVTSEAEVGTLMTLARALGHEGLMAKRLDAPYAAGKRGKSWLKIKPTDSLDVVLLAAEWGHGRRQGTLSNYWLGVRDGQNWQMVGKTFKGLTDADRLLLTEQLLSIRLSEERGLVRVKPEIVVEVAYNDVQKSSTYSSGLTLRFARVKRLRSDKGPADADTYACLRALYAAQFRSKGLPNEMLLEDPSLDAP